MTLDLRHLRHATILADTANFSRAAEQVGITQPALSKSIAALEAEVGFAIFDRTAAGAIPTVMGMQFLKDARALLFQARQLETEAKALNAGESGTLSLGLGPLLASLILPDLLVQLANQFPRLQVNSLVGSAGEILSALDDRRIEMCLFAEGPIAAGGVATRSVGSITLGLLARARHPLAGRKGLQMRDLADFPLAAGSYGDRSESGTLPKPSIVCENYHILRDTVLRSDTIWLSSLAMAPSQGQEALVELDVTEFPPFRRSVLLARIGNRAMSRAGKEAVTIIESLLRRTS
jgi:DNA-binding transcriptional LysR family regulator